jgi:Zn-dependent metalloprotease
MAQMPRPRTRAAGRGAVARIAVTGLVSAVVVTIPAAPGGTTTTGTGGTATVTGSDQVELAGIARAVARRHARDLGLSASSGLRLLGVSRTAAGPVVRLQQTAAGLPVFAGQVTVALDAAGREAAVGGEVSGRVVTDHFPVPASVAAEVARRAVAQRHSLPGRSLVATRPARVLFDASLVDARERAGARAAWSVEVSAPGDLLVRDLVVVDAASRTVLLQVSRVAAATDRVVCDRAEVPSDDPTCEPTGYTRVEGGPATGIADVDQAYDNTGATADWFATRLGVDLTTLIGSDHGDGPKLRSTTRYCEKGLCPFDNAFWTGDQMVYGTGFAAADDVVAHELTHGVTDRVAGLLYWYQSGAISESMSDVFAELVDQANGLGTDDETARWQLGEDLPAHFGGVTRDMADPTAYGQPDHSGSHLYDLAPDYDDNGGVHTNSGVPNKTAYLIADGSAAEPGGAFNGYAVAGIGAEKTGALYWATLQLLTPGADFADLAAALTGACSALAAGAGAGVTATDCQSVDAAIAATGLTRWAGPGVPRRVRTETGPRLLQVTWRPPASAGSSPVTSYVVELVPNQGPPEYLAVDPTSRKLRLERIRPGTDVTVAVSAVSADGSSTAVRRSVTGTRLQVTWSRGGNRARVRGALLDATGAGLPGRLLRLVRLGGGGVVAARVRTRSDGRFRLVAVTAGPGRYRVEFEGTDRLLGAWSSRSRVT